MRYEVALSQCGYKKALKVISETFKNHHPGKLISRMNEAEAVFFKCGNEWFHRNEDLGHWLLKAIGERINHLNLELSV